MSEDVVRGPTWSEDELVLACDLVVANGWHELPATDKQVIELSELLHALPIHDEAVRGPKFRSPNSVRRKMVDLATHHPNFHGKGTKGGKLDLQVIEDFIQRPTEMHEFARLLRAGAKSNAFYNLPNWSNADDEAAEGGLLERRHIARERSPKLRDRKIAQVVGQHGTLACEVCRFDFERTYGERGSRFAECHHVVPLHASGEATTRLSDLAILCANCHRMIHRRMPWLTLAQLRDLIRASAGASLSELSTGWVTHP